MFPDVPRWFPDVPRCSSRDVPRCYEMILDDPRCSYIDVPRCSLWSSATSISDGIFSPETGKIFNKRNPRKITFDHTIISGHIYWFLRKEYGTRMTIPLNLDFILCFHHLNEHLNRVFLHENENTTNVNNDLIWPHEGQNWPTVPPPRGEREFPFPVIPKNGSLWFPFPNFGNGFFHSLPVPEFRECLFSFPSRSRILGMDFFIPFPFPNFGNGNFSFPSRSRIDHFKVGNQKGKWKIVRDASIPTFSASSTFHTT